MRFPDWKEIEGTGMKICVLSGSPHMKGNTAALVASYVEGARDAGHQADIFAIAKMNIKPCMGCMACKKKGDGCVQHDDMEKIYEAVDASETLVFATPLYWWNVTGPLKTAIDRLFALPFNIRKGETALQGKRLQVIMTSGQPSSAGLQSDLESLARKMCDFTGMVWRGIITAGNTPELPAAKQSAMLEGAYQAGFALR